MKSQYIDFINVCQSNISNKENSEAIPIKISTLESSNVQSTDDLVSVGLPVRNGGQTLRSALNSIIYQDYKKLEIIISDNGSTDDTASIIHEYQLRDPRIKYYRQKNFLSVAENFRFVLDQARGNFFIWAAHDDRRSLDYVSKLLHAMNDDPEPILIFGDCFSTTSINEDGYISKFDFDNTNLQPVQRMRKAVNPMCMHLYGLWKTKVLQSIRFYPCIWAWDQPIMPAAAYIGKFKYVHGPKFIYFTVQKSQAERAVYQDGHLRFNKYTSMLELLNATYKTSAKVGGIKIGILATLFVIQMHARNLPGFIKRKLQKDRNLSS